MDLGFTRLDPSRAETALVPLDYQRLVASLGAMQAASRTAIAEARSAAGAFGDARPVMALVEVIVGGVRWRGGMVVLEGAFHPALALRNRGFLP